MAWWYAKSNKRKRGECKLQKALTKELKPPSSWFCNNKYKNFKRGVDCVGHIFDRHGIRLLQDKFETFEK